MVAIVTLVVTLTISLLVTRTGAAALKLTGLSEDVARFQARSAFTGVGFTTGEAEKVVNHPVRRKIVGVLMLCGNIGIAAVIASMMATFTVSSEGGRLGWRLFYLTSSLLALWIIGTQKWVDVTISRIIEKALIRWTRLDVADYVSLLRLSSGYVVLELEVNEGDWVADKSLAESKLSQEGVLVLGVLSAEGDYSGSPSGKTFVQAGDVLTVYGPIQRLEELNSRPCGTPGDRKHEEAIAEQLKEVDEKNSSEAETD